MTIRKRPIFKNETRRGMVLSFLSVVKTTSIATIYRATIYRALRLGEEFDELAHEEVRCGDHGQMSLA